MKLGLLTLLIVISVAAAAVSTQNKAEADLDKVKHDLLRDKLRALFKLVDNDKKSPNQHGQEVTHDERTATDKVSDKAPLHHAERKNEHKARGPMQRRRFQHPKARAAMLKRKLMMHRRQNQKGGELNKRARYKIQQGKRRMDQAKQQVQDNQRDSFQAFRDKVTEKRKSEQKNDAKTVGNQDQASDKRTMSRRGKMRAMKTRGGGAKHRSRATSRKQKARGYDTDMYDYCYNLFFTHDYYNYYGDYYAYPYYDNWYYYGDWYGDWYDYYGYYDYYGDYSGSGSGYYGDYSGSGSGYYGDYQGSGSGYYGDYQGSGSGYYGDYQGSGSGYYGDYQGSGSGYYGDYQGSGYGYHDTATGEDYATCYYVLFAYFDDTCPVSCKDLHGDDFYECAKGEVFQIEEKLMDMYKDRTNCDDHPFSSLPINLETVLSDELTSKIPTEYVVELVDWYIDLLVYAIYEEASDGDIDFGDLECRYHNLRESVWLESNAEYYMEMYKKK